jgi:hypothetical protein
VFCAFFLLRVNGHYSVYDTWKFCHLGIVASEPKYPRSQQEFDTLFCSEEACRAFVEKLRWPRKFVCPRCRCRSAWVINGTKYRCHKHRHDTKLTAGTAFEGSNLSLMEWFKLAWFSISKPGGGTVASFNESLNSGRDDSTIWRALRKIQKLMSPADLGQLSGEIEFYQTMVRSRKNQEHCVMILVPRKGNNKGHARLKCAKSNSPSEVEKFICKHVASPATLFGSDWSDHGSSRLRGYRLRPVKDDDISQAIHVAERLAKYLRDRSQFTVKVTDFENRLNEFTFRHNAGRRANFGKAFRVLMMRAIPRQASRRVRSRNEKL